jgi:tRNA(fMet)-specific endonuclease VapC
MKYLLDTNICVYHLRGKLNLNDCVKGYWRDSCCVSEVTVLELYYGAANSDNPEKHRQSLELFFAGLSIVPITDAKMIYSQEKARLRKAGTPIHDEFDLIIGATAIENNVVLVSDNEKHFQYFHHLKLENWYRMFR